MYYDLHIHSCLSPCAMDDMTPNNIVNMARIKGLDLISVTDHNSLKQQKAIASCAKKAGLDYLYGVEIQTIEEVHVLAYFNHVQSIEMFQTWLDEKLVSFENDVNFFGHQWVMDENDEIVNEENRLLLSSINASIEETIQTIHAHCGKAVLAHVLDRANSVITQLGFIPLHLAYDGIEIKKSEDKDRVLESHPWITDTHWFCNSDAHQLIEMHEEDFQLSKKELEWLRGDNP